MNKKGQLSEEKIIFSVIVGLVLLIALFLSVYVVPAGHRGVLLTWQKPSEVPSGEGFHFKIPVAQKVIKMDVRTQKYVTPASAASKDLQTASTEVAVNFHILADSTPKIYQEIGVNYEDVIIQPAVQEVVKSATAKFTAEELITKRPLVKEEIEVQLKDRLQKRNIIVEEISITDFDFSETFNTAIENKVTAEQNALAAKNKLEQVKFEAEQKVVSGEAEAKILQLQKQAVTPELIELRQIEVQSKALDVQREAVQQWNGVLPVVSGGNTPFISFDSLPTSQPTTTAETTN